MSGAADLRSAVAAMKAACQNAPRTAPGRPRPKKEKEDIFTSHNRNSKKRAAADISAMEQEQKNKAARLDSDDWKKSQRKMEDKARLYAAMKRGDVEDKHGKHMVDFDRKWAEKHNEERDSEDNDSSDDYEDDGDQEQVEYLDELGRLRKGSKAEAAKAERLKKAMEEQVSDRFTARPLEPSKVIYGDMVQSYAFNPDEQIAAKMRELAAKRDKETTPPPDTHYDPTKEVRTKGTGFYHFSKNEDERKEQMAQLEKERQETERIRAERGHEAKKEAREKELEERRQMIKSKRESKQAKKFLDQLGDELLKDSSG